ncbi:MAG: hypothetical protein JOZ10_10645 [Acidobacteria bacterium]|nr:hypothetical protein [Acidobacteriota bacterium]MBV9147227.1 hypothetical protein [Acidobacteriota bacterium]MBV9438064.1 hypothetical protein [Acidobacteriota bacterium]
MILRLNRRVWAAFILLFLVNMIVLALRIPSTGGIDFRVLLLMIASSAVVAFITAVLLVFLYDRISRARRTG